MARRDAERIARDKTVQATLAEFFHAQGEIERIHVEAEKAAAPFERMARDAVRTLDRLGETRSGIAELTGLTLVRVRDCVADEPALGQEGALVSSQREIVLPGHMDE